jgi:hypothetical protein
MNTEQQNTPDYEDLGKTVYRLSLFTTTQTHDSFAEHAIGCLVQLALLEAGRGRHDAETVCSIIRDTYYLDFEASEIRTMAGQLAHDRFVRWDKSADALSLPRGKRAQLARRKLQGQRAQENVIKDWLAAVEEAEPELHPEDLALIESDLRPFLTHLALMWSEEFLAVVHPGLVSADGDLLDAIKDALSKLPDRDPGLLESRDRAFADFILKADTPRKEFLSNLLDVSMIVCSLSISPSTSAVIDYQLDQFVHFADTNLLLFLLGLSDPQTAQGVRKLVELSRDAGARIAVSPRTLTEFREVLSNTRDYILTSPARAADMAREQLRRGRYSPLTAYVQRCDETKSAISPRTFFDPYIQQVEVQLAAYGITLEGKEMSAEITETELEQETQHLRRSVSYYNRRKSRAEHDAFHLLLIRALRGTEPSPFGMARYWFLTCDTRLPTYALERLRVKHEAPFCMLSSAWLTFLRTLKPRSEDFDRATTELMFDPSLGPYEGMAIELVQEAQANTAALSDMTWDIQEKALIDNIFETKVVSEGSKTDEDTGLGLDPDWIREIAEPASKGELTDDIRFREELRRERDDLKAAVRILEDRMATLSDRVRRGVLGASVGVVLILALNLGFALGYVRRDWLLPGVLWIGVLGVAIALPWNALERRLRYGVAIALLAATALGMFLVFPASTAWQVMLGVFAVAGFVRAVIYLIDRAAGE